MRSATVWMPASASSGNWMRSCRSIEPTISSIPSESMPSSLMTVFSEMVANSRSTTSVAVFWNMLRSSERLWAILLPLPDYDLVFVDADLIDAAQRVLRQRLIVLFERPDARAEVPDVVVEDLRAPLLLREAFVVAQAIKPVLASLLVIGTPRLYFFDLPVRIDGDHDVLEARGDATREDLVRAEAYVLDLLARAREAVAQDGLQAEPRAGIGPLVAEAEVVSIHLDVLAGAGLLGARDVLHHANRDDRIEFLLGLVVGVAADGGAHSRDFAAHDLVVLSARERDAVRFLHFAIYGLVLEVRPPAAADVEEALLGRQMRRVV